MDHHEKTIRTGAVVLILAISLRLFGGGILNPWKALQSPAALRFLMYLQTGRPVVRPPQKEPEPIPETSVPSSGVPEQTLPEKTEPPEKPWFTAEDLGKIEVDFRCDARPELEPLMEMPLEWDLAGKEPTVLIVHTHGTESYTKTEGQDYEESTAYRTLDDRYNMVSVGREVKRVLEAGGIAVLHDEGLHDHPSYNGSYGNARMSIEEYLRQYPSIRMVLDIHRDASDGANGTQLTTWATVGGQPSAQLLVMVGTDLSGNHHPNWQTNLALALKLTAQLERADPGITRPLALRAERFNMDLTAGSLLIEVGAAGDTHEKALLAANALARGILALAKGANS